MPFSILVFKIRVLRSISCSVGCRCSRCVRHQLLYQQYHLIAGCNLGENYCGCIQFLFVNFPQKHIVIWGLLRYDSSFLAHPKEIIYTRQVDFHSLSCSLYVAKSWSFWCCSDFIGASSPLNILIFVNIFIPLPPLFHSLIPFQLFYMQPPSENAGRKVIVALIWMYEEQWIISQWRTRRDTLFKHVILM